MANLVKGIADPENVIHALSTPRAKSKTMAAMGSVSSALLPDSMLYVPPDYHDIGTRAGFSGGSGNDEQASSVRTPGPDQGFYPESRAGFNQNNAAPSPTNSNSK